MERKRKRMVAGNWKMNLSYQEGRDLGRAVVNKLQPLGVWVVLGVPYIHLKGLESITHGVSRLEIGAQNCHQEESGAYTGEVSAAMLKSVGTRFVILGHSERREYFGETDELIARKVDQVLKHGMEPIFCCGEKLDTREAGKHIPLVTKQIEAALFHLDTQAFGKVVIAYEPVWAIGTGKTASAEQAQEMHREIRQFVASKYGAEVAEQLTILYGGSCNPKNASSLFSQPDVDGGLIGGASLKADDFIAIIESFPN
jgi:triosephosphate isomerase